MKTRSSYEPVADSWIVFGSVGARANFGLVFFFFFFSTLLQLSRALCRPLVDLPLLLLFRSTNYINSAVHGSIIASVPCISPKSYPGKRE